MVPTNFQTEQDYGTNEEESKEMDGAHQFESIASSVVEISHINADWHSESASWDSHHPSFRILRENQQSKTNQ